MNDLHPLARKYLKSIKPYRIVSNFQYGITEKINTSAHFLNYSKYPDIEHKLMKQKYIQYIATNEVLPAMLTTDNILFTSGASEAINLVLQAFCDPFKDHICVTPPTFGLYEELAIRHQVDVKISPLLGKNFDQLNFIELKNSNAKIIYLCSPNNPVGTELKFNEIHHLLTNISNTIIVIDETYFDFSSNKKWLALLGEYENLVFIRSFSKAWGLAGVRAGVVIANKSIIDVLRLIQLPFTFSEPAQESVSKRLEQIDDIHKLIVSLLIYVKCYLVF